MATNTHAPAMPPTAVPNAAACGASQAAQLAALRLWQVDGKGGGQARNSYMLVPYLNT